MDYIDSTKLQEYTTKLAGRLKTLFSPPQAAATAAAMTDHNRVYVYIKDPAETGYETGKWYYWDETNSAWAAGGVYQSQGINTDTTLLLSGYAADSKAAGDAINASFCYRGLVESGANANDMVDYGLYRWQYNKVPTNAPEDAAGNLLCLAPNNASSNIVQLVVTQNKHVFVRWKTSSSWSAWVQLADKSDVDTAINAVFGYRGVLDGDEDANDLTSFGLYRWGSGNAPTNAPEDLGTGAGCLICFGPNSVSDSIAQIIITYGRRVFVRWKASAGWLSWVRLVSESDLEQLRGEMALPSTGDSTDRKSVILSTLQSKGYCKLGPGDFYISHFTMPDNTTLEGCGDATKLYYIETEAGPAITMGSKCSVLNLSMVGSSSDLTFNEHFFGATFPEDSTQNLWEDGNVEVPTAGYKHLVLTTPLPPGSYRVYAEITSDNTTDAVAAISFSSSQSTSIPGSSIIDTTTVEIGDRKRDFFTLTETAYSVRLCSRETATLGEGHEATWANISIEPVCGRCGIAWKSVGNEHGSVVNCRFSRFDCAGIIMWGTGTPTYRELIISACSFDGNNIGVYSRRDSEFNKIVGCTVTRNNYGMLIRGGNNYITGCGIDSNTVGIQVDMDEGGNNGHGAICNCSLNHSGPLVNGARQMGYSLIIKDTGREMVSNCTVGFGKILLQNTNGNILSNMSLLSYATVEITDGGCNMLCNSIVRSFTDRPNQVILTNNTQSKVINVYNRSGRELTPITAG